MATTPKKVIVIGGGVSGLTAGIYLLKYGYEVEIMEKNATLGGMCTGWERKGSHIDGCIHWLTESDYGELNQTMKEMGALGDGIDIYHGEYYCQTMVNGKAINFYLDTKKMEAELLKYATKNDAKKIKTLVGYFRKCRNNLIQTRKPFHMWNLIDKLRFLWRVLKILPVLKNGMDQSLEDFANSLESEELRFAFRNTITPSEYSIFAYATTWGGICDKNSGIPLGGSKAFSQRMVQTFEKLGGKISTLCAADHIETDGEKATGVVLKDGTMRKADYYVPAVDVHFLTDQLLEGKYRIRQIDEAAANREAYPTFSIFLFSYRTKADLRDVATNRYVQTKHRYNILNEEKECIYIKHFGYDPLQCRDGYTTVQIIEACSEKCVERLKAMTKDEYKQFKAAQTDAMKDLLNESTNGEYGELETLDTATPLTFIHWVNAFSGSFMAHAMTEKNVQLILRNDALPLENVVMAGNWLLMPGGVPTAIMEGKFAAMTLDNRIRNPKSYSKEESTKLMNQPLKKKAEKSSFRR